MFVIDEMTPKIAIPDGYCKSKENFFEKIKPHG